LFKFFFVLLVNYLLTRFILSGGVRRKFSWGVHSVVYGGHVYLVSAICDVTL